MKATKTGPHTLGIHDACGSHTTTIDPSTQEAHQFEIPEEPAIGFHPSSTQTHQEPSCPDDNPFSLVAPLTSWRKVLVFVGINLCIFLQGLDQTIVATTLSATARQFNNFADISWVGTIFLLTSTAVLPLYGPASDMFGRKRMVLFAVILFLCGCTIAGVAQSMIMLIIGRAIQGMGGGGLLSIAKMITADIVPRHRLGAYQGFTTITYIFSSTIGPLVGGIISDGASWRWTYFINLPIGGVTFLILAVLLHVKQPLTSSFRDRMATVDYMGILLLFISVIMILLGLNWGADAKYAWDSATILSLLIIGIVVGCLFLINEWRAGLAAKQPIIPLHLFGTRSLAANQVCMLFQSFVYLGQVFAIPLYFQATAGISGAQAGLNLLPLAATAASTECIVGFLMNFFNTTKEFIVLGYIIGTIGCMCLTLLLNEHTPRWQAMVLMIPQGMCLGFTFNAILLNVYSELYGHRDTATATALWAFLRSSGATMGIAAALASIQSSLSLVGAGDYANNIQAIKDLAPEIRGPIIHAFLTGMHRFMLVCTVLSGASLFCSFFIQRLPISRPTLPEKNQIDEPMQREKDVV